VYLDENMKSRLENKLIIEEASRYFGIGEKKLCRLVNSNLDTGFVIQNGVKIRFYL